MKLLHLSSTLVAASFALACAPAQLPPPVAQQSPAPRYVTITPHVSVSANAQPLPEPPTRPDVGDDVMADILAIPPGSASR